MAGVADEEARKRNGFGAFMAGLFRRRIPVPVPAGALAALLLAVSIGLNVHLWPDAPPQGPPARVAEVRPPGEGIANPPALPVLSAPFAAPGNLAGTGAFLLIPLSVWPPSNPLPEGEGLDEANGI